MGLLDNKLEAFRIKIGEKLNALKTEIGLMSPFKGLSPNAGNNLTQDAEGKLFYKEKTAAEIKIAYESNLDTNAFTDAFKLQAEGLASSLEGKVDKVNGEGLTPAKFTQEEKDKLAGIEDAKWKGEYPTIEAAKIDWPEGTGQTWHQDKGGWIVDVDSGAASDVVRYIWDATDLKWIPQAGSSTSETSASIKTKYEANADTNAFTDSHKTTVEALPVNVEPAFAKKTAFNKDYGLIAGTTAQGNDSRIINGQNAFDALPNKADVTVTNDHETRISALEASIDKNIDYTYIDIPTMIANQNEQLEDDIIKVTDASGAGYTGKAYYFYDGTIAGTIDDYTLLTKEEIQALTAQDVIDALGYTPADESEVVKKTTDKTDMAALYADQANQEEGQVYRVLNASAHSQITHTGWAEFKKLATSTGAESDYELRDQQDFDTPGGGSETLSRQTSITTNTTLNGSGTLGLSKYTPVDASTDLEITIDKGTHAVGQIHNFRKNGNGQVKFLRGKNVRLEGKRNINNEHVLINKGNFASLIWDRLEGSTLVGSIIGDIQGGYTGQVTTSSYSVLTNEAVAQDVTVIGTGFSENMIVSLTGNATLNSWTFVNNNQVTLNITPSGVANDNLTVTYDNGDVFVDTDAITIQSSIAYDTADLRHYYRLDVNSNDAVPTGKINGSSNAITFTGGFASFNGTTSYIDLADDNSLSWGNGTTDSDLSFTTTVNPSSLGAGMIFAKRGASTNKEFSLELTSGGVLRIAFFDQSTGGYLAYDYTHGWSTGTDYHIGVTKTGSTIKMFIDGSVKSPLNISSGTYIAMENGTSNLRMGALPVSGSYYNGKQRRLGLWGVALSAQAMADVFEKEVTNNQNLL